MSNQNLATINPDGSFDRVMIMRIAHRNASTFLDRVYGGDYRAAFKSELKDIWNRAAGQRAIYQARTGQTRAYVGVARDVMLPA